MDVRRNVERHEGRKERTRDGNPTSGTPASDYCFNYFRSFYEQNRVGDICCPRTSTRAASSLPYLASWGMLRGNTTLLKKSARIFTPLLERIVQFGGRLWEVGCGLVHGREHKPPLGNGKCRPRSSRQREQGFRTLVTKIMLGVYGNVPAFDRYVRKSLGVNELTDKSLRVVSAFYEYHMDVIDGFERENRAPLISILAKRPIDTTRRRRSWTWRHSSEDNRTISTVRSRRGYRSPP